MTSDSESDAVFESSLAVKTNGISNGVTRDSCNITA